MAYYPHLFQPLQIGTMTLPNRAFMSAMGTNYAELGTWNMTQQACDYYAARAKGGFGLIIIEDTTVQECGAWSGRGFQISSDRFIPEFRKLTDAIHAQGVKTVLEISHLGRSTDKSRTGGLLPVSASPVPDYVFDTEVGGITYDEIQQLRRDFVAGARRCKAAGFDGVEIHCTHGYLMASFLSGRTNKRTDEYGGTLEGRLRLLLEVIDDIRLEVGRDYPLIVRLAGHEANGGRTVEETMVIAKALEDAGVDALDISSGSTSEIDWEIPPAFFGPACNMANIERIKSCVSIPVLGSGRVTEPRVADLLLEQGRCDMVGLNRASIADPDIVRKAGAGRTDEIRRCIGCCHCINSLDEEGGNGPMTCAVNPYVGREGEIDLSPVAEPKHVLIVGAGPAGLECANLAAKRGHTVTVLEKSSMAGGQVKAAAVPPGKHEMASLITVQMCVAKKLGVRVVLNTEATPEVIDSYHPDAVIVAAGAEPFLPAVPGLDGENVVTAIDLLEGRYHAGDRVVVLGGGLIACETTEFLSVYPRKHITLLSRRKLEDIGKDIVPHVRPHMFEQFMRTGVELTPQAQIIAVGPDSVTYRNNVTGEESVITDVDTVVAATGVRPEQSLYEMLRTGKTPVYLVGDAASVGSLQTAMHNCYGIVSSL